MINNEVMVLTKETTKRRWTSEEIQFLTFAYPNKEYTLDEISIALGISKEKIRAKASHLKLKRPEKEPIPSGFKRCSCCQKILPFNEFHRQSNKPSGRRAHCKTCRSANERKNPSSIPHEKKEEKRKVCNKCGQSKPLNEFYKSNQLKYGRLNTCIDCKRMIYRKYQILGGYTYDKK